MRLWLGGTKEGLARWQNHVVELEAAGRRRGLRAYGLPRPRHLGGTLQSIAEVGNALELKDASIGTLRRDSEPHTDPQSGENVGGAGMKSTVIVLIAPHPRGIA